MVSTLSRFVNDSIRSDESFTSKPGIQLFYPLADLGQVFTHIDQTPSL